MFQKLHSRQVQPRGLEFPSPHSLGRSCTPGTIGEDYWAFMDFAHLACRLVVPRWVNQTKKTNSYHLHAIQQPQSMFFHRRSRPLSPPPGPGQWYKYASQWVRQTERTEISATLPKGTDFFGAQHVKFMPKKHLGDEQMRGDSRHRNKNACNRNFLWGYPSTGKMTS